MIDLSYKQIGPGVYQKWNALLGIRTTLTFADGKIHVKKEQRVEETLDLNVAQQNDFRSFKGMDGYIGTRIPLVEHEKIMERCGHEKGKGYDVKKFKQIVNDRDNYKFKLVPGRI